MIIGMVSCCYQLCKAAPMEAAVSTVLRSMHAFGRIMVANLTERGDVRDVEHWDYDG